MASYTHEQEKIFSVCKNLKNKQVAAIVAPAGSGKTFTLVELAKQMPDKKILYLAFNKAIKEEAKKKFPKNVTTTTAHGLAYKMLGVGNSEKWKLKEGDYSAHDIMEILDIKDYIIAENTKKTFDWFLNSNEYCFDKHKIASDIAVKNACELYARMLSGKIEITHSFYFKQFERQKHTLNYDVVLLDEAQDSNDVTLSIFFNLKGAKVLVGDPHQAIYSFRGSVNAFKKIKPDYKLYLTSCFRCNADIVERANEILSLKGKEVDFKIVSKANNDDEIKTRAVITRTNGKLVYLLADAKKQNKKYILLKNPKEFFEEICELVDFIKPQVKDGIAKPKKSNRFNKYGTEDNLKEIIETSNDISLQSAYTTAKQYGRGIFKVRKDAMDMWKEKRYLKNHDGIYLMTAHASKGLEFDEVFLMNDFPKLKKIMEDSKNYTADEVNEEINLYYVAVTRAKKILHESPKNKEGDE